MSLPRSDYDPRRVCLIPFPTVAFGQHKRSLGVYTAGALVGLGNGNHMPAVLTQPLHLMQFALGCWIFLDAAVLSAHAHPPPDAPYDSVPVHVTFVDWLPGIFSVFGLLIVNLIDKERLIGEGGSFGEGSIVWRARLFLFLGFALMAGGLAGSVVRKFKQRLLRTQYLLVHLNSRPSWFSNTLCTHSRIDSLTMVMRMWPRMCA